MGLFSSRVLWNGVIRFFVFWLILSGVVYAASLALPFLNLALIVQTVDLAVKGQLEGLSSQAFAFALATLIATTALGFVVAYFLMHVVLIWLAIADAGRQITRQRTSVEFAERFDTVDKRLSRHPLIGQAWRAFDQTTFRKNDSEQIQTTVRPGTLINIGNARERLTGLKMMGSVPGYFVGVGLFLTFIGLVLALQQASAAVGSSDAEGMQAATRQLLKVATFKFATSIAGLGSSIVLSIFFRIYTVWIESAFDRFNHALEDRLRFVSSQSIAWNMHESLAAQLTELKQINSSDFFARNRRGGTADRAQASVTRLGCDQRHRVRQPLQTTVRLAGAGNARRPAGPGTICLCLRRGRRFDGGGDAEVICGNHRG
ncbi:anti-phage ZorAB system protein ZorA [Bradyrhizobium sp. CW10]|uniref:anti-phage ZorAB system protein ZorA n=1 Tax=Bradyrhizobium sp. CW10 TaxID=2782683 RepID=UPI001FFB363C|nr:anti-phage ZorAB system protein ZorA [Bradyrhizobium sp. CW10]MCK1466863.1 anti-phage defense protein ZorA [Bradyrhizobium sp. CW10]